MATIKVQPASIEAIKLPITGKTPLIVHRFNARSLDKPEPGIRPARNPEKSYNDSRYVLDSKSDGFPASGFKKAAVRAAKMIDGLTMTDTRQMFFVLSDAFTEEGQGCVRIIGDPSMREDVVRLPRNATDLRYRAQYIDWSANLTIEYDADLIKPDTIVNLFSRAGFMVGVGEWRPEKSGTFGTFTVGGSA